MHNEWLLSLNLTISYQLLSKNKILFILEVLFIINLENTKFFNIYLA